MHGSEVAIHQMKASLAKCLSGFLSETRNKKTSSQDAFYNQWKTLNGKGGHKVFTYHDQQKSRNEIKVQTSSKIVQSLAMTE